ncbi:MAG: hypothetical protein OEY01_11210 [Desulfobulbaceae bacterium]|nr:hypothetical protein [Desulfobulbaceae bacterium]
MSLKIYNRLFEFTYLQKCKNVELALILESDRGFISHLKKGTNNLTFQKLVLLAGHFKNLDLNWLIRGEAISGEQTQSISSNGGGNTLANIGGGFHGNMGGNSAALETEVKHLKAIIKEKDEQIKILKSVLKQ